jgi:uncharacterized GH25 family protein
MRRKISLSLLLLLLFVVSGSAHDLFLKFDSYFLRPNASVTVRVLNGSFQHSESAVARDRIQDVSLSTPSSGITHLQTTAWRSEGKMALLNFQTGAEGTYVVGLSMKQREYDFKADEFNKYLIHDGLPEILAERRKSGELRKDVRERYAKHVRAVFQVGAQLTDNYKVLLGYPLELIPQQNPYGLAAGQDIEVLCLKDGQPLIGQSVTAGLESKSHKSTPLNLRTNEKGLVRFRLSHAGKWYVKTVHMQTLKGPPVDYESNWSTLTFEIK